MIIKMKYISISGHICNKKHVVQNYLQRYDIQLENPDSDSIMKPLATLNPYTATLQKAKYIAGIVGKPPILYMPISEENAVNLVEEAFTILEKRNDELQLHEQQIKLMREQAELLQYFTALDVDIDEITKFVFTSYRFGRLPAVNYMQYEKFLADNEKILFIVTKRENDYVWGVYFTPTIHADSTDAVFASLKFELVEIASIYATEQVSGSPTDMLRHLTEKCAKMEKEVSAQIHGIIKKIGLEHLAVACAKVQQLYKTFDFERYASISPGGQIFSFSGWVTEQDANILEAETDADRLTILTFPTPHDNTLVPPIRLKNPRIIRPFEFFTHLYGLPSLGEADPTPFLAITYTILFGIMFGDVGHGATLAVLGLLVRYKWKTALGGIIMAAGASAFLFGFMYGSIFGFEDVIPALWRRPAADITGTLLFAVGLGVVIIVVSILLSMYNAFRKRDIGGMLFGANGAAGLVFYAAIVHIAIRLFAFGLPVTGLVVAVSLFPLVFVTFKLPLERFIAGRNILPHGEGVSQFIFNTIIELFETLLTYATNTISFVRVGAFAVSHAGMMHVVLQLSQNSAGGRSWLVVVLGNVLVLAIEGLLVGIQVLRLDFYEMFSRFYTGDGQEFVPNK